MGERIGKVVTRTGVVLIAAFAALGCAEATRVEPPSNVVADYSGLDGVFTRSAFLSHARGWVHFNVYLPPGWTSAGTQTYPLLVFLHGQFGNEYAALQAIRSTELNRWIAEGLIPPFVLIAPRGSDDTRSVQWYDRGNARMLGADSDGELRAFARTTFRAGLNPRSVSVHGHSRGATGALYLAFRYPEKFASAVANAFVSDYALERLQHQARRNRSRILASGIGIRMSMGSMDEYANDAGRTGSARLVSYLQRLGIPHEYEYLPGATHSLSSIWSHMGEHSKNNGLVEMQYHASHWEIVAAYAGQSEEIARRWKDLPQVYGPTADEP